MNFKKTLLATLTTFMVGGVVLSANQNTSQFEPQAAADDKRIYVYLEGGWDAGDQMYIYYWGGSTSNTFDTASPMTQVINDYWQGMFYYDVPVDTTNFLVKDRASGNGNKNSNQSVDISMSSIFLTGPTNYKAVAISAWLGSDGTKRNATTVDNLGLSNSDVVALLNKIDTCSSSTANGFNAYPQIDDLFFTTNTFTGSTTVDDDFGGATTITDKKNRLSENYSRGSAV
ncbi:MAG: hypothetical protein FJ352_01295 [Firmicutes bacterium]|nr:hypothetical protein [Bacillota bacterium]